VGSLPPGTSFDRIIVFNGIHNFFTHLITTATNVWANNGYQILRLHIVTIVENGNSLLDNALGRTSPSSMYRRYGATARIRE
jgi:hypothetical protein